MDTREQIDAIKKEAITVAEISRLQRNSVNRMFSSVQQLSFCLSLEEIGEGCADISYSKTNLIRAIECDVLAFTLAQESLDILTKEGESDHGMH